MEGTVCAESQRDSEVGKVVCYFFLKVGTPVPAPRVCPMALR